MTGPPAIEAGPSPYATQEATSYAQPPSSEEEAARREQRVEKARKRWEKARQQATAAQAPQVIGALPDIAVIEFGYAAEDPVFPIHPVDVEYHIAAQHNPVLREIRLIAEHESIPAALQGNLEACLGLCADYGIDEEDDAEALDFLEHHVHSGPAQYMAGDPLDVAWEETLTAYEMFQTDTENEVARAAYESEFEAYQALVENTYGVEFTQDKSDPARNTSWNLLGIRMAHVAFEEMARALSIAVRDYFGLHWDDGTAFRRIIGKITIHNSTELPPTKKEKDGTDTGIPLGIAKVSEDKIVVYWKNHRNFYLIPNVMLHELGHILNANGAFGVKFWKTWMNLHEDHPRSREGMGAPADDVLIGSTVIESNTSSVTLPMLYQDIGVSSPDHVIFRRAQHLPTQIQSLQQSPETDDSTEVYYDRTGRNEVTADAILNWVKHLNSGGRFGFTSEEEGLRWLAFMDENMGELIQTAIVQVAMQTGDPTYVSQIDGFPKVFGSGTVQANQGLRVRTTPMVKEGNILTSLQEGEKLLILGRSKDELWIATAKKGVLAWMYYGFPKNPLIALPEGVNIRDLPIYDDHATLDFGPSFR